MTIVLILLILVDVLLTIWAHHLTTELEGAEIVIHALLLDRNESAAFVVDMDKVIGDPQRAVNLVRLSEGTWRVGLR